MNIIFKLTKIMHTVLASLLMHIIFSPNNSETTENALHNLTQIHMSYLFMWKKVTGQVFPHWFMAQVQRVAAINQWFKLNC